MKKIYVLHFAMVILLINILCVSQIKSEIQFSESRLIVKFKINADIHNHLKMYYTNSPVQMNYFSGSESSMLKSFFAEYKIKGFFGIKLSYDIQTLPGGIERIYVFELEENSDINNIRMQLLSDNRVEYAEFDYVGYGGGARAELSNQNDDIIIPNDPFFGLQWGYRNTGQVIGGVAGTAGADMNMINAWNKTTGNSSLKIAILDSGIPLGASEFSGRLVPGYDFANNDNNPTDDHGHGSNVSSIAAAKGNNNSVMAGANWNCKVMPVKILNSAGSGLYSWWISGITMAADSNAKVLNMSVGGSGFSQGMADAITYANSKGSIVVACMMNNNNSVPYYPAAYGNVISIGATNNRDRRAVPFCWGGGSSFGAHIDFSAPGEYILGINYLNPSNADYWCGTSQATPAAAGLITLLLSLRSTLTYNQIYNLLKSGARDQVGPAAEDTPGFDNYFGWGRLDGFLTLNSLYSLNINAFIQGFYDSTSNTMVPDTVTVYIRNVTTPFAIVDTAKSVLGSNGDAALYFLHTVNGTPYYIVVKHRNLIETWSSSGQTFTSSALTYNFSTSASQAYGNNLAGVDITPVRYALYNGDVNQDGSIDAQDIITIYNDQFVFSSGYLLTDLNGDNFTDVSDLTIAFNNGNNFVSVIRP